MKQNTVKNHVWVQRVLYCMERRRSYFSNSWYIFYIYLIFSVLISMNLFCKLTTKMCPSFLPGNPHLCKYNNMNKYTTRTTHSRSESTSIFKALDLSPPFLQPQVQFPEVTLVAVRSSSGPVSGSFLPSLNQMISEELNAVQFALQVRLTGFLVLPVTLSPIADSLSAFGKIQKQQFGHHCVN